MHLTLIPQQDVDHRPFTIRTEHDLTHSMRSFHIEGASVFGNETKYIERLRIELQRYCIPGSAST